jgi:hypothetical protein
VAPCAKESEWPQRAAEENRQSSKFGFTSRIDTA